MKPFILIGLTPQGLSMLRLLSRAGYKVIAFTNTKSAVGYGSKYGEKYVFNSIEDLKTSITKITGEYEGKLHCIITSGELLSFVLNGYPELYDLCEVQSGPLELIKMLSNKKKMYEFAASKGLNCAKHTILRDYVSGELSFPVILKRNIEVPLFFKTKKIESEEELTRFMLKIERHNFQHILVQEYITIEKFKEISIQAYLHQGEMKGCFLCYQERRLSSGITSFLKEVKEPDVLAMVTEKTRTFFSNTGYTGFCELEFIYDLNTRDLHFIEVNTRACGLHSVLNKKFSNLQEVLLHIDNPPELESRSGTISWINVGRDVKARIQKKDIKNLLQFFTSKHDIWDINDLKPFFYQIIK